MNKHNGFTISHVILAIVSFRKSQKLRRKVTGKDFYITKYNVYDPEHLRNIIDSKIFYQKRHEKWQN